MRSFGFDKKGFIIDGKREFLVGGEIAHFRVPKNEWERRMRLFKEAGGNMITTSVAWLIHEPEEGKIVFNDTDFRDLKAFLETANEVGLLVYVRPGPLVYTELINGGIPDWLFDKYPQTQAMFRDGTPIRQLSYMHPLALEKFKIFYSEFAKQIKPYLITNGGPVAVIQLDNELAGIHTWSGTLDYNPETMGFLTENGLYTTFIRQKYEDISNLNKAYKSNYNAFSEVDPRKFDFSGNERARAEKDYHDFYCYHLGIYSRLLLTWLRDFGIDVPVSANAANAYLLNYLTELSNEMKDENFIIGFDNYYGLDINWNNFHPTPKWYMKNVYAADALNMMGYPFNVLEMQLGTYTNIPPVLSEDLKQWYMINLALGMKGVSYYIFSGGENPPDVGMTTDVYDFQAPVSAEGEIRKNYYTLKEFNQFMLSKKWLLNAERVNSVQVGYEWQLMRGNDYAKYAGVSNSLQAEDRLIKCLSASLFSSKYSYCFKELKGELDKDKPLILCCADTMSEKAQKNIVNFIENGGKVYILSTLPSLNESFECCTILKDYLGDIVEEKYTSINWVTLINNERVYCINCSNYIEKMPEKAEVFATDVNKEKVFGFKISKGKGMVYYLCGQWLTKNYDQVQALEHILNDLGAKPCVEHSNPCVYATLLSDGGKSAVFIMNLYTGTQESNIRVHHNGKILDLGNIVLSPSEVKYIEL